LVALDREDTTIHSAAARLEQELSQLDVDEFILRRKSMPLRRIG
jgi:hypothetical protein